MVLIHGVVTLITNPPSTIDLLSLRPISSGRVKAIPGLLLQSHSSPKDELYKVNYKLGIFCNFSELSG